MEPEDDQDRDESSFFMLCKSFIILKYFYLYFVKARRVEV
jgi:hypothetical protein